MAEEKKPGTEGHPLPASEEARQDLLPEHLVAEKGLGGDAAERVQPEDNFVNPDGEPYAGPAEEGNC
jgi:hypothetical protein